MDNILKMLLGVLSVAGVFALIIPETNPLADNSIETRAEIEAPPPSVSPSLPPPPELPDSLDAEPVSDFQIGAPTIDGKPMQPDFGMPYGATPQLTSSKGDAEQSNSAGFTPPVYVMPGSTPPMEAGDEGAPLAIPAP